MVATTIHNRCRKRDEAVHQASPLVDIENLPIDVDAQSNQIRTYLVGLI
jgi:hypothetical protein